MTTSHEKSSPQRRWQLAPVTAVYLYGAVLLALAAVIFDVAVRGS
jgi:FlaG/FlaF family flagellin (archaellin)